MSDKRWLYLDIPDQQVPFYDSDYLGIYRNKSLEPFSWTSPIPNNKSLRNGTKINYDPEQNSHCFRSQEFYKLDNQYKNILVAGCSETFGWEIEYRYTWPYLLNEHMANHFDTQLFSVAYPGASIHANIRNIYAFIENYGNPDYIFMYLPDTLRNLFYYNKSIFNAHYDYDTIESMVYTKKFSHETQMFTYTTMIYALEKYCDAAGVKMIWSSWCSEDMEFYKKIKFKYLYDLFKEYDRIEHLKNDEVEPFWEKALDGAHFGYKDHAALALAFYDNIKKSFN